MRGVFVTGTDTDVGKTVVSACLVRAWNADYWKPVQTGGNVMGRDACTVARLAACASARIHASVHDLEAPLSPHAAARMEGVAIGLDAFHLPRTSRPIVVEGAGGVLVPLNEQALMADLMARLALPVVLVARTRLGTINHSLLSIEALRARGLPLLGVVLCGPPDAGNREAIARYGQVRILAEVPPAEPLTPAAVARFAEGFPGPEVLTNPERTEDA